MTLLFKFGEVEHLRSLQAGTIYLNSWCYFKTCESKADRDPNEGTHKWMNPAITSIEIGGHKFTAQGGTLSMSLSYPDLQTKIFCMSVFCSTDRRITRPIFDPRLLKLGDHMLVIHNVGQFVGQLDAKLKTLYENHVIEGANTGKVTYFDENTYDGEVGPFFKTSNLAFQEEWRLVVRTIATDDKPFTVEIGSIEKISLLMETKNFKNRIELRDDNSIAVAI
jgi:hypothetical protein